MLQRTFELLASNMQLPKSEKTYARVLIDTAYSATRELPVLLRRVQTEIRLQSFDQLPIAPSTRK